ncbi:reverse transcriptase [Caerostris darwini]|uniref:Reverse transcriptase n=1 Tax=Caerostris darwini TaxID=1538125 RepID=A0AAV4T2Q1_9ARAC|nr:reverse transcriptase [Caerostris darwini]
MCRNPNRRSMPRSIISGNGAKFISYVLHQIYFILYIRKKLIPIYFPQADLVEPKNRDLKPRLAIPVGDEHDSWHSKLPFIRNDMNTAICETMGDTPTFLQFHRELRAVDEVV